MRQSNAQAQPNQLPLLQSDDSTDDEKLLSPTSLRLQRSTVSKATRKPANPSDKATAKPASSRRAAGRADRDTASQKSTASRTLSPEAASSGRKAESAPTAENGAAKASSLSQTQTDAPTDRSRRGGSAARATTQTAAAKPARTAATQCTPPTAAAVLASAAEDSSSAQGGPSSTVAASAARTTTPTPAHAPTPQAATPSSGVAHAPTAEMEPRSQAQSPMSSAVFGLKRTPNRETRRLRLSRRRQGGSPMDSQDSHGSPLVGRRPYASQIDASQTDGSQLDASQAQGSQNNASQVSLGATPLFFSPHGKKAANSGTQESGRPPRVLATALADAGGTPEAAAAAALPAAEPARTCDATSEGQVAAAIPSQPSTLASWFRGESEAAEGPQAA